MTLVKIILIPFSILYSFIILIRNKLYDSGLIKSYSVLKPVISIGNITTGGTGKTPLTIFIAEYFLEKGKKVGIVSRGYNRNSENITIVCDGRTVNNNVNESGDELILISNELIKNHKDAVFTAAGSNRVESVNLLINKFNPDIIILDDAFQHRRIKRNLDIVIIDAAEFSNNNFMNKFLLPSGNLRENISNIERADIIIQNNKNTGQQDISELTGFNKPVVTIRYKTEYFMDYKNCILQYMHRTAILFSGIANNESFISMVRSGNINISDVINFPDHHNYTENDIYLLTKKHSDNKIFITTEKDFVKVRQFESFVNNFPVYFLKLGIEVTNNGSELYNKLENLIK